jgi:propionyl-CoA carboxylase alpha chain
LRSLPAGWRNSVMPPESVTLTHPHGHITVAHQTRRDGAIDFTVNDWSGQVAHHRVDRGDVTFECDGSTHRLDVLADGHRLWVQGPDGDVEFAIEPRFPEQVGDAVEGALLAPMPGKVVSVAVAVGDAVEPGQLLMIVEAMKMEHRVVAPEAGTVTGLRAAAGDQVQGGDLLVVIEPAEAPA